MSPEKLILLLIAMIMLGLVLFLAYKLDIYEEKKNRKEKNTKKQNNEENFYTEFNPLRNEYKNEINQTSAFSSESLKLKKDSLKNDKYSEKFDKTAIIEKVDLSKLEIEENEIENEVYEDDEYEDELYTFEDYNSSTMVFNTTDVKSADEIEFKRIKNESAKNGLKSTDGETINNAEKSTRINKKNKNRNI